jgi:hypothetical protein
VGVDAHQTKWLGHELHSYRPARSRAHPVMASVESGTAPVLPLPLHELA